MRRFCHRHSYRGGKSAAELIYRLRAAPAKREPDSAEGTRSDHQRVYRPDQPAQHADHLPRARDRSCPGRSPQDRIIEDPPTRCQRQPRGADRRDRPPPGAMRQPRTSRRHVRRRTGHQGLRQITNRQLPLHRQQARPRSDYQVPPSRSGCPRNGGNLKSSPAAGSG